MMKSKDKVSGRNCGNCYWFRGATWHIGTQPITKLNDKWEGRACTLGWEKREQIGDTKIRSETVSKQIDGGGVVTAHVCSGWRDCGLLEEGMIKSSVIIVAKDKEVYRQWLESEGIPYEE